MGQSLCYYLRSFMPLPPLIQVIPYLFAMFCWFGSFYALQGPLQFFVCMPWLFSALLHGQEPTPEPPPSTVHTRRRPRPPRRRNGVKFCRRRIHYHLYRRCMRRRGQRPPRLDGTTFHSPRCIKHRRWRRRRARFKAFKARIWRRRVVEHEFFLEGRQRVFEPPDTLQDDYKTSKGSQVL